MACFVGMLIALMSVSAINLTQLVLAFPGRAQIPSCYRRMQRFFSDHWLDYNDVAHFIMKLFGFTDLASGGFVEEANKIYGLRWEIETLFGSLKGRGFKLEKNRLVGYLRIKKLVVLPVMAFCWVHKVCDGQHDYVLPIKIKIHRRKAQSIFRYGLDVSVLNGLTPAQGQTNASEN